VYLQEQLFAAITGALNAGHFKPQNARFFVSLFFAMISGGYQPVVPGKHQKNMHRLLCDVRPLGEGITRMEAALSSASRGPLILLRASP